MCFATADGSSRLVTAADGELLLWNLESEGERCSRLDLPPPEVKPSGLGSVRHIACHAGRCSSATGRSIAVHDLATGELERWLDGHSAGVTATAFAEHRPGTLVSVSEDRTFVVWDLDAGASVFTSCIESPTPFSTVAVDPALDRFAVGSIDGTIRFYTFHDFKLLHALDYVAEAGKLRRYNLRAGDSPSPPNRPGSASPRSRHRDRKASLVVLGRGGSKSTVLPAGAAAAAAALARPSTPAGDIEGRDETVLLELAFSNPGGALEGGPSPDGIAGVLEGGQVRLLVGLTTAVGLVDSCSMSVLSERPLGEGGAEAVHGGSPHIVRVASTIAFGAHSDGDGLCGTHNALVCGAFDQLVELVSLQVDVHSAVDGAVSAGAMADRVPISMLPEATLLEDSPLHAVMTLVKKTPQKGGNGVGGGRGSNLKAASMSSPVTFGRKIKSSGYATPTKPRKMFQPRTDFGGDGMAKEKRASRLGGTHETIDPARLRPRGATLPRQRAESAGAGGGDSTSSLLDCDAPSGCVGKFAVSGGPRPAPVHSLRIGPSGRSVASLVADCSVSVVKLSVNFGKSTCRTYLGHGSAAVSASWSVDSRHLLTASSNEMLVWDLGSKSSDPVLRMENRVHNFKRKDGGDADGNCAYGKGSLSAAQFYYMDKFVLAGHGGTLSMYKYALDSTVDDLKRKQTRSRYREVVKLAHPGAKSITAVAAANNFYSYLVLTAGSDRSLNIFDMNCSKSVLVLPEAHTRPPHLIELNRGSRHTEMPPDSFNVFFTAAMTDGITMWDLRAGTAVRRFVGHSDRATPVGLDFSPCGRYVATGSEDRHAYVYDVRTGSSISRLPGHTDVVTDVSFRPERPGLLTSSVDGNLRMYE